MKAMFLLVSCLFALLGIVSGNVMSVDLGSDSMKIAIVQPGMPMEIVSNLQSKRKTPTCIAFYKGERMFGSDGYALMGRKPELALAKFNRLIGRSPDHPRVSELKAQYFPYEIYLNDTTMDTSIKVEEVSYTPEELLAMLLQHAKLLALNHGGKVIKDCVITVPSSFTQHERSALYTAASIADLNILTLIEENTAAALQYGIDRVHETPTNVLYYNMGAEGVQVSIVTYSSYIIKESGKNKTIGQFEVIGKAWDESVGGFNFDLVITDMLADRFNEIWRKKTSSVSHNIKEFARPMTRLRLEANKIKEVLSANSEFHFKAEQLHDDLDLVMKITRHDFEVAAEKMLSKIINPVKSALVMANISLTDINAVELLGGSVRIPKVKKILDDYFQKNVDVGQHMNGDEAMALGAAFRAANLSTAFRVRKVGMSDILTFGVSVTLETLPATDHKSPSTLASLSSGIMNMFSKGGAKEKKDDVADKKDDVNDHHDDKDDDKDHDVAWEKHTSLYPVKNLLPGKTKTLAFQYDHDILCKLHITSSDDTPPSSSSSSGKDIIAVYNITGISDFAKEMSAKGLGVPKVHLSFSLDSSGIVTLHKAEATVDLPVEPSSSSSSNDTSSDVDENANVTDATSSDAESTDNDVTNTTDTSSTSSSETKSDKKSSSTKKTKTSSSEKKKEKETKLSRVLTIIEDHLAVTPATWTPAAIAQAKNRLKQLDGIDEARKQREAALNDLEGYIYSIKNKISDDEDDKISSVTTSSQREEIMTLASTTEDWLYDDGRTASLNDFKNKHTQLKSLAEVVMKRVSELKDRPEAIKKAKKIIAEVEASMMTWEEKYPQINEEEKEKLSDLLKKASSWMEEKEAAQAKLSSHETPAYDSSEVLPQLKAVYAMFEKLLKKPKPAPEKVTVTTNTTTTSDNTTSAAGSTAADSTGEADTGAADPIEVKIERDEGDKDEDSSASVEEVEKSSEEDEL